MDGHGNIIVADCGNNCIRKITLLGYVSTLAGIGEGDYRDGGGTAAQFSCPFGLAVDGDGNVIVADYNNHCIRKITPQGQVSTLAGTGQHQGHRDGEGTVAEFYGPWGIAVDGDGDFLVADFHNHRIRKITPQGQVSSLAGIEGHIYNIKGHRDGDRVASAQFN
jgi:DNA-binding beta-propeller fold protein YncE